MNSSSNGGSDLEDLLEHELREHVGKLHGPRPLAAHAAYNAHVAGGRSMSIKSTVTALVAAALVTIGGAVVATAATGSRSPDVWGRTVRAAVENCKDQLQPGQHGIGECVSAVARQNGPEDRAEHRASDARTNHPTGKPTEAPSGKHPEPHHGKPSGVPDGSGSGDPSKSEGSHGPGTQVSPSGHNHP